MGKRSVIPRANLTESGTTEGRMRYEKIISQVLTGTRSYLLSGSRGIRRGQASAIVGEDEFDGM